MEIRDTSKLLWADLENDAERVEFLLSGRAHETGVIAQAIVWDVAAAFAYRNNMNTEGLEIRLPEN